MKKIFLILISILMVLSLSACGNNSNGGSANVKKTIIEDTTLNKLTFTVPESTKEVTRFIEQKTDGTLVEKDINYKLESEDTISIGYMPNQVLSELMDLSNFDSYEVNSQTVYLYGSDTDRYAFIQIDKDLYAVEAQGNNAETLVKNTVDTLGYDGNGELILNDSDLYDITYVLPETDKNISNTIGVTEDIEGNVISKYIIFVFGEGEDVSYRLEIEVYKNTTIEELTKDSSKELTETEINGVKYTVVDNGSDPAYRYYTQHNEDVYRISNNGKPGWLFPDRTEESYEALDKLLNTISFK